MRELNKQRQPSSNTESITEKVDDVKVCDICGDAGLEESLAICSRCVDGAEHIYCMETMLDKLPDSDWLCEGCKLNELEFQNAHKSEKVVNIQEQSNLNEDAEHARGTLYSKVSPKRDGGVIKEGRVDSKALQNPEIPYTWHGEIVDASAFAYEKASKSSSAIEICTPQDVSLRSLKDSLTNSFSAGIVRGQKAYTSSGPLLKSSSFRNTNTKPKVKQLFGAIPLTKSATGKFPSKFLRKDVLTRGMIKSNSFKTEKLGCNDFELITEKQSVGTTQNKYSNVERNKDIGVVEREDSSALDFPEIADAGTSGQMIDSDNSGYNKNISLHSLRSSTSAASNGLNLQDQKQLQDPKDGLLHLVNAANDSRKPDMVLQSDNQSNLESIHQVDVAKAGAIFSTLNNTMSGGSRMSLCQNCNETGHHTNLCPIDKHSISSNKWNAASETVISKQEALKSSNAMEMFKEPPIPSFDYTAKVANIDVPSQSFRRMQPQEVKINASRSFVFDKIESTVHKNTSKQTEIQNHAGGDRLDSFANSSKEFDLNPSEHVSSSSIDPCLSSAQRTSVIPVLEFFWQGCFEVLRAGRHLECCDGLQAHYSSYASVKVFEVAKEFPPSKVQLEEVPCKSCWPQPFLGNLAKEHNVALFFFAKDIESYRNNYCKLLEKMLKYDLALKGSVGGFELLIFPSNKLSESSQRWNRLHFLWGAFKRKRSSCLEVLPNGKDLCKSALDVKFPTSLSQVSNYQETKAPLNSYVPNKYAKLLSENLCSLSSGRLTSSQKPDL